MNKRRLLKLAVLLEADARNKRGVKFNLYTVVNTEGPIDGGQVKLDCGTHACAMGLAAISGAFKRCGLSYKIKSDWSGNIIATTINGKTRQYDRAAMVVFGLTMRQADFLFTPSFYPETEMSLRGAHAERYVAKRIRDFVAGKVSPA